MSEGKIGGMLESALANAVDDIFDDYAPGRRDGTTAEIETRVQEWGSALDAMLDSTVALCAVYRSRSDIRQSETEGLRTVITQAIDNLKKARSYFLEAERLTLAVAAQVVPIVPAPAPITEIELGTSRRIDLTEAKA